MTRFRVAILALAMLLSRGFCFAAEPAFSEEFDAKGSNLNPESSLGWIIADGVLRSNAPTE